MDTFVYVLSSSSVMFKNAEMSDFDIAFDFIEKLWDYNTYDRDKTEAVYQRVLEDENTFAFFLVEDGDYKGFCHGAYFDTFWMTGQTCYVSSLITREDERCKGYGAQMLDQAAKLAKERDCKAMVLDSGLPRTTAHKFYEDYGFDKGCYGFDLVF